MSDLHNRVDEYAQKIQIDLIEGQLSLEEIDYNEYVKEHPTWESFSAGIGETMFAWGDWASIDSASAKRLVILASLQQLAFPDAEKVPRDNIEYIRSYFSEDVLRSDWDQEGRLICLRLLISALAFYSDQASDTDLAIWAKEYSEPCAILSRVIAED